MAVDHLKLVNTAPAWAVQFSKIGEGVAIQRESPMMQQTLADQHRVFRVCDLPNMRNHEDRRGDDEYREAGDQILFSFHVFKRD